MKRFGIQITLVEGPKGVNEMAIDGKTVSSLLSGDEQIFAIISKYIETGKIVVPEATQEIFHIEGTEAASCPI